MKLIGDLFSSDVGLLSAGVLAFVLVMAAWFIGFFMRKMREDEARARSGGA